jgi:hypothetical protein
MSTPSNTKECNDLKQFTDDAKEAQREAREQRMLAKDVDEEIKSTRRLRVE